jgi:hypothetical protein
MISETHRSPSERQIVTIGKLHGVKRAAPRRVVLPGSLPEGGPAGIHGEAAGTGYLLATGEGTDKTHGQAGCLNRCLCCLPVPNLLHHQDVGVHFGDCPLDVLGVLGGVLPAGPRAHAGKPFDVPRHEAEFPGQAGRGENEQEDDRSKEAHSW